MNKRKLGVAVSAMILAVHLGIPLAAEPTLEQLTEIATILTENDVAALCDYLDDNPALLEGDAQLAVLLRQFQRESRDLTSCLGIEPNLRDALLRNRALPRFVEGVDPTEDEEPPLGAGPDPEPPPDPDPTEDRELDPDPSEDRDPEPAPDPEDPDPVEEPDPAPAPDPGPIDGGLY